MQTAVRMDPPRTFRRVPLLPHQMLDRVTSQRDLFVLAHVGVPRVDASAWTVSVTGLLGEPATLTFDQIRRLPKTEVESFHQCAGYPSNPKIATRRVGNVVWGGADLKTLLDTLGVSPRARFLWSYGVDTGDYEGIRSGPYLKDCPLERVAQGGVLLAYEINGEPLDAEHGFPLRLIVPGFYGTNSVKWLSRLHLADARADGPFTTQLYNDPVEGGTRPVWAVAPESVIVSPAPDAELGMQPIEIWGWAWADGGVAQVEISTDGGASWRQAQSCAAKRLVLAEIQRPMAAGQSGRGGPDVARHRQTRRRCSQLSDWRNCVYAVRVTIKTPWFGSRLGYPLMK